ncbi:Dipeptide transport system permease protein DppC (TC 3.A.1.5.2) [hydrothermal vent metagenome]|uniref:Dipeptide transport system permease protein DppC (TC 3.A.1.5.2) n=1 Tax=hydrothermal vent metagenome TaxID=652676 RepID=A0A3B1CGY8_9ZZZZ|nr:MAG: peptide ABC transporter permease [bacterium]
MSGIFYERFGHNKLAVAGSVLVALLFFTALLAPVISPYKPDYIDRYHVLEPPGRLHPLGTDDIGRDVMSRMIYGSRVSLSVGFVAVGIATFIGMIMGAVAGYYGGIADRLIMRFVDVMLSIPSFFFILAVIAFVGPSIWNIMIIIGITSWMGVARLVRAEFLTLKSREYILAARAIGASDMRIILRHMLPNSLAPVIISAVLGVASAVLLESSLSFLGLGVQPPMPSWGNILTAGKANIEIAWWLSVFPGVAILITVLSYNLLGEGLRDALDPRLWERR